MSAFVQAASAAGTSTPVTTHQATFGSNTSSGNLIFVAVSNGDATGATTTTVSDSQSNTYTSIVKRNAANQGTLEIFYAKNITGGATPTVTATFSGSVTFPDIAALEYSGLHLTAPLDQFAANDSSAFSSATDGVTVGPVTPTEDGELVVGAVWDGFAVSVTISAGTGWTERVNVGNSGTTTTMEVEDFVQSTAGAITASWTSSESHAIATVATFKQAAAGGGSTPFVSLGQTGFKQHVKIVGY